MNSQNLEFQVTLGLQQAQSQAEQLKKVLQESVRIDSNSFKSIMGILESAEKSADKLSAKMSSAFKTSSGAKNFLKEYETMIGSLVTAYQKLQEVGSEEFNFSVKDQKSITDAVKKIEELSTSLDKIQNGKAIELINVSDVQGIDNLRQQITGLNKDVSDMNFDGIRSELTSAMTQASDSVKAIKTQMNDLDNTINSIRADGLKEVQTVLNSTISTGGITRIINAKEIDTVNERLRALSKVLTDITINPMTITKGDNIVSFIDKQTKQLEKKYQTQIKVVQSNRDKINTALNKINDVGARYKADGSLSTRVWSATQAEALLESTDIKDAISKLDSKLDKAYDELKPQEKIKVLRQKFQDALQSLGDKEINLKGLQDSVRNAVDNVFDGLGEIVIGKKSEAQEKIKTALTSLSINPADLKGFGFDLNEIHNGQALSDVYTQLKTALQGYIDSLEANKANLSGEDLAQATAKVNDLKAALTTISSVESNSATTVESLNQKIQEQQQIINQLVSVIQQLRANGLKNIDFSGFEQGKKSINDFANSMASLEGKQKSLSNVSAAVSRWMGFYQVLNLAKRAVNDMKKHIQELDSVMTQIAVVTNMSQSDLWNQIGQYSEIARQYGVAIKGVYEVSQIFYQQGLNRGDTMTMTTETLKMARIAGIDYATAADYMTTAVRGFKLEMSDAAHVTDVFSNLAAHTASSTEELATAISKTAASAEAVGSSFEATSAMIATMVSVTRESATNIGTALKSVISRYGEMTSDPSKLQDAEGEEMSLNRVDKALQTIGISIHDVNGQFRDFDDVILELGEAWGTLDSTSQRYIATLMAGNRQQSRFLALISNIDEYKRALELANNADETGDVQVLKTLDSVDAKIEKMRVTIQEFYTSSGLEDLYKGVLDGITNIISAANSLPKLFDKIPALALGVLTSLVTIIKTVLKNILADIQNEMTALSGQTTSTLQNLVLKFAESGRQAGREYGENVVKAADESMKGLGTKVGNSLKSTLLRYGGMAASLLGGYLTLNGMQEYGASTTEAQDRSAGTKTLLGGLAGVAGGALSGAAQGAMLGAAGGPHGIAIGAVLGGVTGLIQNFATLASATSMLNVSIERQIELSKKRLEEAKTEESKQKGELKELTSAYEKLMELRDASQNSAEAMEEYVSYMNQLGETYPEFIGMIESSGDTIIDTTAMEKALTAARQATADATLNAIKAEKDNAEQVQEAYKQAYDATSVVSLGFSSSGLEIVMNNRGYGNQVKESGPYGALIQYMNEKKGSTFDINYDNDWQNMKTVLDNYTNAEFNFHELIQDLQQGGNDFLQILDDNVQLQQLRNAISLYKTAIGDTANNVEKQIEGRVNKDLLYGYTIEDILNGKNIAILDFVAEAFREIVSDSIVAQGETLANLMSSIGRQEITKNIQTQLGGLDIYQSNVLQKYVPLMTSLLGNRFNNKPEAIEEADYTSLFDWLFNNQSSANKLLNFDYTQFRDFSEIDLSFMTNMPNFEEYKKVLEKNYDNIRDSYLTNITEQLGNLGLESELAELTNGDIGTEEKPRKELNTGLLNAYRKVLTIYGELQKDGLESTAENYKTSLIGIFDAIGSLDSTKQLNLTSLINKIDLTNPEELYTMGEQIAAMGNDYTNVAEQVTNAGKRIAVNLSAQLLALQSNTAEVAKKLESVADKFNKGVKYSEALETVTSLGEDVNFDDVYEYSDVAGGWILNQVGIDKQINSIIKENKEKAQQIKENATRRANSLSSISEHELPITRDTFERDTGLKELELDLEWDAYNQIIDQYNKEDKSTRGLLKDYIAKRIQEAQKTAANAQATGDDLTKRVLESLLQSVEYTSIAGGTNVEQAKASMQSVAKAIIGEDWNENINAEFETAFTELTQGKIDSMNQWFSKYGLKVRIGEKTEQEMIQYEAEQYQNAITELLTKGTNESLSDTTKQLEKEAQIDIEHLSRQQVAEQLLQNYKAMYNAGKVPLEAYNQVYETYLKEIQEIGKFDAALSMFKSGVTYSGLESFANNYQLLFQDFFDESGELVNEELLSIFDYDKATQQLTAKEGISVETVLTTFFKALGLTIDTATKEGQEAISASISTKIANLKSADAGLKGASAIQSITSAKVGDYIDVSGLPQEVQDKLGANQDHILQLVSEAQRESWIMALDFMEDNEPEYIAAIREAKESMKSKHNIQSGTQGIISEKVSISSAKAFAAAIGDESEYSNIMTARGYLFNEYTQQWEATTKVLENREKDLRRAVKNNASAEEIAQINAMYDDLAYTLGAGKKDSAIMEVLSNYKEVSNVAKQNLIAAFAEQKNIDWDTIFIEEDGHYITDISALLAAIGDSMNNAAKNMVTEIANGYIGAIGTAANLMSQGTTSLTEMEDFTKQYNEIVKPETAKTSQGLFSWDDTLHAMAIKSSTVTEIATHAKQKALEDLQAAYGDTLNEDQIKQLADDTIIKPIRETNFDAFTGGTATEADKSVLRGYLMAIDGMQETTVNTIMNELSQNIFTTLESIQGIEISRAVKISSTKTYVNKLKTAIQELTYNTIDNYSEGTLEVINDISEEELTTENAAEIQAIYQKLKNQIGTEGYTQADYNKDIAELQTKLQGLGSEKATIDMLQNGFDLASFGNFLNTYVQSGMQDIDDYFKDGKAIGIFEGLFEVDEQGLMQVVEGKEADVAKAFNQIIVGSIDTSGNAWKALLASLATNRVSKAISNADLADVDKQAASQIKALGSAKFGDRIDVHNLSAQQQKALTDAGMSITNGYVEITSQAALNAALGAMQEFTNDDESKRALQEVMDQINATYNRASATEGIISNTVSKSAAQILAIVEGEDGTDPTALMESLGFTWDEVAQAYVHTAEDFQAIQDKIAKLEESADTAESKSKLAKYRAMLSDLEYAQINKRDLAIRNVLQNYSSISNEMYEQLKVDFGDDWTDDLEKAFTKEGEGYRVDPALFISLIGNTSEILSSVLASIATDYANKFTSALNLTKTGTTSLSEMQTFQESFKQITGISREINELFSYNGDMKAWTLNAEYLKAYYTGIAEQMGLVGIEAQQWIEDQLTGTFIEQIDFKGLVSSIGTSSYKQTRTNIETSLKEYYQSLVGSIAHLPFIDTALDNIVKEQLNTIEGGGIDAVKMGQAILKDKFTDEDAETLYMAEANRLGDAFNSALELEVNNLVTNDTLKQYLGESRVNSDGVVTSVDNMLEVYNNIYADMKNNAETTTSALNSAYATILTKSEQKEMDAISALGDAMGMSYDSLGDLVAGYGHTLEEVMLNSSLYGISKIGNGQIRIDDFQAFADSLGLAGGSEEYTNALKAYNDALIALDRKVEDEIYSEISAITEAKPGERINLTQLYSNLNDATIASLRVALSNVGATFNNGILQLTDNANISGIISAIISEAQVNENLLPEQIAELQDAVNGLLQGITDTINTGIEGKLSNVDVQSLKDWAAQNGLANINFTSTAEGFKLTEDSIFDLYASIRKINQESAKKLLPNIKNISNSYKNLASTTEEYNKTLENTNKRQALEDLISSFLKEPSSMNTMGYGMPEDWEFAQEYYENLNKGRIAIENAEKDKQMGIQDFGSIMATILSNSDTAVQAIGGMTAKEWLDKAPSFYSTDKNGNLVIDFEKAGIKQGDYEALYNLYYEAAESIREVKAEQQRLAKDLNAASEDIDLSKLFGEDGGLDRQALQKAVKDSSALKKAFEKIDINGESLNDIISQGHWDKLGEDADNILRSLIAGFKDGTFTAQNFDEKLSSIFGQYSDMMNIEVDANGNVTVKFDPEKNAPIFMVGDQELDATTFNEWVNASQIEGALATSETSLNIPIGETNVTATLENQTLIFRAELADGTVITADSMSNIRLAIATWASNQAVGSEEPSSGHANPHFKVEIDGYSVEVELKDGEWHVSDTQDTSNIPQTVISEIEEKLESQNIELKALNEKVSVALQDPNATFTLEENGDITVTGEAGTFTITQVQQAQLSAAVKSQIESKINNLSGTATVYANTATAASQLQGIIDQLDTINGGANADVTITQHTLGAGPQDAGAKGNARAQGTLMGELGPELWVAGGHYYVAGQNGAEFVDLPKDAIVFNHLQTQRLLGTGKTGRGKPITSEQTAVAMARGTAMAAADPTDYGYGLAGKIQDLRDSLTKNNTELDRLLKTSGVPEQAISALKQTTLHLEAEISRTSVKYQRFANTLEEATKATEEDTKVTKDNTKQLEENNKTEKEKLKKETGNGNNTASGSGLHRGYKRIKSDATAGTDTNGTGTGTGGKKKPNEGGDVPDGSKGTDVIGGYKGTGKNGGNAVSSDKYTAEQQKALKSALSNLVSKGVEAFDINDSAYDKLGDDLKAKLEKDIYSENFDYEKILTNYWDDITLSISEKNEMYKQALEQKYERAGSSAEINAAYKNLTRGLDGSLSAESLDDFLTLFGNATSLAEAVEGHVIEWSETQQRWIVDDTKALEGLDTYLSSVTHSKEINADKLKEKAESITENISNLLTGAGAEDTAKFLAELTDSYGIKTDDIKLIKGINGQQISTKDAKLLKQRINKTVKNTLTKRRLTAGVEDAVTEYRENTATLIEKSELHTGEGLSRTEMETLITDLGLSVDQFFKDINGKWKAKAGEYQKIVEAAQKEGDVTKAGGEHALSTEKDGVREYYNTIRDYINQGVEGNLSNENLDKLKDYWGKKGLGKIKDDWFKDTEDGMELTVKGIASMRKRAQNIDDNAERAEMLAILDDSTRTMTDTLYSGLDSLIEGTMSGSEFGDFKQLLEKSGITPNDDWFEETTNGVMLTIKGIDELAEAMKGSDYSDEYQKEAIAKLKDSKHAIAESISESINGLTEGISSTDFLKFKDTLKNNGIKIKDGWFQEIDGVVYATVEGLHELDKSLKNSGLDDAEIEATRATIKDTRRAIASSISSGLDSLAEGKMSSTDLVDFKKTLTDSGMEWSKKWFAETADGVGITYEGLTEFIKQVEISDYSDKYKEELINKAKDTMQNLYTTFQDGFSSLLSGTMSYDNMAAFEDNLKRLGADVDKLDYVETGKGLQLTTESAINLYTQLSKTNALQASLTFEELRKNLEETNRHYKNTATISARVKDINKELTKLKKEQKNLTGTELQLNKDKIKALKQEETLAKNILAIRAADEDETYKEIDSGYDTSMNNPANIIKSATTASERILTGYMSGEDLYAYLKDLNNQAAETKKSKKFGFGKNAIMLNGSEESLTAAYNQALSTTGATFYDSEGMKVDLSMFGIDTADIDKNVDVLEKQLKKRLMALRDTLVNDTIPRLEIKQAMTEQNFKAVDIEEMFDGEKFSQKFVTEAQKMLDAAADNEDLKAALETTMVAEGVSLIDIFNQAINGEDADIGLGDNIMQIITGILEMSGTLEDAKRSVVMIDNTDTEAWAESITKAHEEMTGFVAEVERWYNYLQKIEGLENAINIQEKQRAVWSSDIDKDYSQDIAASYQKSYDLQAEREQTETQHLRRAQRWTDADIQEAKDAGIDVDKIFKIDRERGTISYRDAHMSKDLTRIFGQSDFTGEYKLSGDNTASNQYNQLVKLFDQDTIDAWTKYDKDGKLLVRDTAKGETTEEFKTRQVERIWDLLQSTTNQLHDDLSEEQKTQISILEAQAAQNELLKEQEDAQINLQNAVLSAIENMRQQEIDDAKELRDAYKEQTDKYISSLQDALKREKSLYESSKDNNELKKLQNRLAILQRSGGSAAEISSLEQEIEEKQYDIYFDKQQEQIDLIQEAANNEIERLDNQIDIMTESLEYEKEHGLLWNKVYEMIGGDKGTLMSFLQKYTEGYEGKSALEQKNIDKENANNLALATSERLDANTGTSTNTNTGTSEETKKEEKETPELTPQQTVEQVQEQLSQGIETIVSSATTELSEIAKDIAVDLTEKALDDLFTHINTNIQTSFESITVPSLKDMNTTLEAIKDALLAYSPVNIDTVDVDVNVKELVDNNTMRSFIRNEINGQLSQIKLSSGVVRQGGS